MASVIRSERTAPSAGSDRFARTFVIDPERLSAFRLPIGPGIDAGDAQSLSTLIETEIIPRLMVAHATATPTIATIAGGARIAPAEVEAFAPLAMQVEADALLAHVEAIMARGVAFDTVLVDLLAPAARLLGEYWEEDRCDFVDVTMGLWRLQEVVHEIAGRLPAGRSTGAGRRALFASMPGDQHSFGTVVIDELFRRNGWRTDRVSDAETADLLHCARDDWYDMIGLTISCDCHIATLGSVIVALRKASRNPRVCVMVGGRIFSADPDLATHVGADGTARDARLALKTADALVRAREREAAACN